MFFLTQVRVLKLVQQSFCCGGKNAWRMFNECAPFISQQTHKTSDFKNFALLCPVKLYMLKEVTSPVIQNANANQGDCISVGQRPFEVF